MKIHSSFIGASVLFCASTLSFSAYAAPLSGLATQAPEVQEPKPSIEPASQENMPEVQTPEEKILTQQIIDAQKRLEGVTLEDLKKDPQLALIAVNFAILSQNWQELANILPVYRNTPNPDWLLIDYAQASIYKDAGEYKKAIALYRKLIAQDPNLSRIRMDLAMVLFADKQDIAARDQFIKLRSDTEGDEFTRDVIDNYLDAIDKRSAWNFDLGLNYIQDNNVNNASSSKTIKLGGLTFVKQESALPQKAHGFGYSLGASKDFNFSGSNYWTIDASSNGKIYWDKHEYDDINLKFASGYKYKDSKNTIGLTPFVKRRFVDSKSYSRTFGLTLSSSRWLNSNWQLSNYNELAWERFYNQDQANERQFFTNLNALWVPSPTRYFVLGANLFDVKGGSDASSYIKPGANFVWNQDWPLGISSKVNLGYSRKFYKGANFTGIKREDNVYNANLTLWNREWYFWGITPKLTFDYDKVDSNIDDLYSYDKSTVFLKFDKTF